MKVKPLPLYFKKDMNRIEIELGENVEIAIKRRWVKHKLIKVTKSGYNFYNEKTTCCLLEKSIYPQKTEKLTFLLSSNFRIRNHDPFINEIVVVDDDKKCLNTNKTFTKMNLLEI